MNRLSAGFRNLIALGLVTSVVLGACADDEPGVSPLFNGCDAGAESVIAFLQRSLDDIGDAQPGELGGYEERFDYGVAGLLARAQEVHCTEEGFNDAIIARVDDLEPRGPAGERLIDDVSRIGLGSSDEDRGGPLRLPGS